MKSKINILMLLFGLSCLRVPGQLFTVNSSLEGMGSRDLSFSNPWCHSDGFSPPYDWEKAKNHTQGDIWARSLRFIAIFRSNCAYNLGNSNQLDWNKAMFIQNPYDPEFTSIRLGWRYNNNTSKMELGLYAHIRHFGNSSIGREFLYVNEVSLGNGIECELILGGGGVGVIAGYKGSYIKRRDIFDNGNVKTAFRRLGYFGGQSCAPHNMQIEVFNINGDQHSNWNYGACEKTFSRSFFYSGENLTIEAGTSITMSEQVFRGQYNSGSSVPLENNIPTGTSPPVSNGSEIPWFESEGNRFVKIESGANIVAKAGSEIILLPGFESENGSNFEAFTGSWITCANWSGKPGRGYPDEPMGATDDPTTAGNENNPVAQQSPFSISSPGKNESSRGNEDFFENGSDFFAVVPNPSNGDFDVKLNNSMEYPVSVVIMDVLGRKVAENSSPSSYELKFNLQSIPAGVYIVKVNYQNTTVTQRIIKN